MKRTISIGLWIVGGLLLLIALVFGGASILSLLERVQHGPGLLFADVEFFGFIALIAAILGVATLFAAKKLSISGKAQARLFRKNIQDILENTNEIIVLADMPGVESKSVDIDLKDNQLTITGKVDAPEGEKEMSLYKEFNWGDYFRQFTLSNVIDQGKISAKIENGVLRLILPKVEKAKPQKIKVVTG